MNIYLEPNTKIEDLVNMLTELEIETGVDLDALLAVAEMVRQAIPHPLNSALLKSGRPWMLEKAPDCQVKLG